MSANLIVAIIIIAIVAIAVVKVCLDLRAGKSCDYCGCGKCENCDGCSDEDETPVCEIEDPEEKNE